LLYPFSVFQEEKRTRKKTFYAFYFDAASSVLGQFGNCIIRGWNEPTATNAPVEDEAVE
jgi:hypothetical protein